MRPSIWQTPPPRERRIPSPSDTRMRRSQEVSRHAYHPRRPVQRRRDAARNRARGSKQPHGRRRQRHVIAASSAGLHTHPIRWPPSPSEGPQKGPQGACCGPCAVPSPANRHEMPRTRPPRRSAFSRRFARVRGCSRTCDLSGRTVRSGFAMRFLVLLRPFCGPKSRAVPRPGQKFFNAAAG